MKQHEAVVEAMKQNGGFATLGYLYQAALKIPGCDWGTKTPFASIRRIVQQHRDLFFKIRPGLWALIAQRKEVLEKLAHLATGFEGLSKHIHSWASSAATQILGNRDRAWREDGAAVPVAVGAPPQSSLQRRPHRTRSGAPAEAPAAGEDTRPVGYRLRTVCSTRNCATASRLPFSP